MIATVEGVLTFNNEIRDEMLKRNIGKYSQWGFKLNPAIGEYYDIDYNRPLKDLRGGKTLLEYTHDNKSDYSKEINKKFFSFGEKEEYYVQPLSYNQLNPWIEFQSGDYIQYIDEVFGKDDVMKHVDYINNLLSGQYIENALRQTEVGVIKDINVAVAMQGIVTTNPNNMSGEDTTLGKISNQMYAHTLYNGAIFNSDRMKAKIKVGENYYNKSYITPDLVNKYGNNLANVFTLSDILRIDANETGIREDLGRDVRILDGYDNNLADLSKEEFRFLSNQIFEAKNTLNKDGEFGDVRKYYTLLDGDGYVNWVKENSDWRFENKVKDVDTFISETLKNGNTGKLSGKYTVGVYNEGENTSYSSPSITEFNEPDEYNNYSSISDSENSLLSKTSKLFNDRKIDTLIARFHTSIGDEVGESEFTDTAKSKFGNSHGRNLLVLDAWKHSSKDDSLLVNGYENPYCRTWTYHHQYNQIKKLIRPFTIADGENERAVTLGEVQEKNHQYRAFRNDGSNTISGTDSLVKNSALQDNGFVRISPHSEDKNKSIKNCMFSIENLAWKDVLDNPDNLSKEQRGPNGGRVMWFPPYDLDFQEGVSVEWNQNAFIGRGEKVYTYTNTERTGTLSFSLLIDHPSIINSVVQDGNEGLGEEKDVESDILRFFAGCNLLEPFETENDEETNIIPTNTTLQDTKKETLKFKIYFPNNFSGVVTNKDGKSPSPNNFQGFVESEDDNDEDKLNGYDEAFAQDYWWQYMLVGSNTCVPTEEQYYRGYEMLPYSLSGDTPNYNGFGISDDRITFTNKRLYTCVDNKYNVGVHYANRCDTCSIIDGTDVEHMYSYHVDDDLHQKLINIESHTDSTSFQLNVNFDTIKRKKEYEPQDNEYTFAELMMALLKTTKIPDYNNLYYKYKNFVINTCHADETRIDKLVSIFTSKNVHFDSMEFSGSADGSDKKNASMLAKRRGYVVNNLVKRMLQLSDEVECKAASSNGSVGNKSNIPSFDYEQKKDRYCELTINYTVTVGDSKAGSIPDVNTNDDEVEGSGVTLTYDEYITAIREYSPSIKQYYFYVHDYDNNNLNKSLREHFNNEVDKKHFDVNNETDLKNETDIILEKYVNRNALILGYVLTKSGECSNFRTKYEAPCTVSSDDCTGYSCLKDCDGNLLAINSAYTGDYTCYFTGAKAILEDYSATTSSNCNNFNVEITSDDLKKYYNDNTYESYELNADKLIKGFILGRFVFDKFDDFGINSSNNERYMIRLYELLSGDEYVNELVNKIILGCRDSVETEEIICDYDELFNYIVNGENNRSIISTINTEIEQSKEQARKNPEDSQKIEENRKQTEENKSANDDSLSNVKVFYGKDTTKKKNVRYETEAEYFENIKTTDPILWKNLKNKFKYFQPAYHSISPEGFNARLTFLHQCTRQGQTCEAKILGKNNYTGIASNLAFGRMPVCVIRIGDFINTRAIINNMSISYAATDGIVWDLNSEGAGVQPMYAKISLGITLLGGQSLGAPISRLQNAISFNYYANAEVYDNRADVAEYSDAQDNSTSVEYKRIWSPLQHSDSSTIIGNNANKPLETRNVTQNNSSNVTESENKAQDGTWKDLTNEQIEEKMEPVNSTPSESDNEEMVAADEITTYITTNSRYVTFVEDYLDKANIIAYCNSGYKESNYQRDKYKNASASMSNVEVNTQHQIHEDEIIDAFESLVEELIMQFVENH